MALDPQDGELSLEDRFFLRIATKNALISEEEAARAGAQAARSGQRLESVLLGLALLDERQVQRVRGAMAASQVMRLDAIYAELLLQRRLVTQEVLDRALDEQRQQRFRIRLGNILVDWGVVSPEAHRAAISDVIQRVKQLGPDAYTSGSNAGMTTTRAAPSNPGPPPPPPTHETRAVAIDETMHEPRSDLFRSDSLLERSLNRLSASDETEDLDGTLRENNRLMVSAIRIGIDSGEAGDPAFLDSGLRDSVDRWAEERTSTGNFVLDRLELEDPASGTFLPDAYVAKRRTRARLLKLGLGALLTVLLGVVLMLAVRYSRNRSELVQVRELIDSAADAVSPAAQEELYRQAQERLTRLEGPGVGPELRRELLDEVEWGRLRADALALLKRQQPGEAKALLERRVGVVSDRAQEEYQGLLRRAKREQHLLAAAAADERGDVEAAVFEYREAQQPPLGDPGGTARGRLEAIRARLEGQVRRAYEKALASLSEIDQEQFSLLAKQIKELFGVDPGAREKLSEIEFRRAMAGGRKAFEASDIPLAKRRFERAQEMRPEDSEVKRWLERANSVQAVGAERARARAAEARGRWEDAIEAYERARKLAREEPALRKSLAAALVHAREQRTAVREARERRRRRAACVTMLKESRIEVAIQNLEALLREREDPETRRLLTFAEKLHGMVYVSPGPFVMGSQPGGEAEPDELPQRTVTLPGFFIDKTEVTNEAYARFVAAGKAPRPSHWTYPVRQPDGKVKKSYDPELDDHPVIKLTWREARAYARWRGGDLPTEPEWEKAARGTDGRTFPWGEGRNVKAHILISPSALRLRRYKTAPVGTHGDDRSPYGVLDMAGNVNEWTRSHLLPYPGAPKGLRLKTGRRVIRGGAYRWPFRDARCAARDGAPEDEYSSAWIGFRVVVEVPASLPALR